MNYFIALIACFQCLVLSAHEGTFSRERLIDYDTKYQTETKQLASEAQLTTPPCASGLLPIVIVNNSGLSDDKVFILVLGNVVGTSTQIFLNIDTESCPGKGSAYQVKSGDNATTFTLKFSQLPLASTFGNFSPSEGRVLYLPSIAGGRVYFSMNSPLNMPVNAMNKIVAPNFTSPSDPNYKTIFDKFEVAYDNTKPNVNPILFVNGTAVDFFSLPLQGIVFNPVGGGSQSVASGLSKARSVIMADVLAEFDGAVEEAIWKKLFLMDGADILRVLNPTKSIAQGSAEGQDPFDKNYLDNSTDYGFSYLEDIWYDGSSFYKSGNELHIKIPIGTGSGETYQADFTSMADKIEFSSTTSSKKVVLQAPTTTTPTTTAIIFAGNRIFDASVSPNVTNINDAQQISQLFEEAIIAGVLPKDIPANDPLTTGDTVNPNSKNNLSSDAAHTEFYKINPNLSMAGKTSGPWFSLYSKALHDQGLIYTYAFDEGMWPAVLIGTQAQSTTYLQITVGDVSQ